MSCPVKSHRRRLSPAQSSDLPTFLKKIDRGICYSSDGHDELRNIPPPYRRNGSRSAFPKVSFEVICYLADDTPNNAGFRQQIGGMDPDSTRALPLRSGSVNKGYEVQTTTHPKRKKPTPNLWFNLGFFWLREWDLNLTTFGL